MFKAFINERGLAIKRKSFELAGAGVINNIKGVNRGDLRRWLIRYKLKSPLLLINGLISTSNHSVGLSS